MREDMSDFQFFEVYGKDRDSIMKPVDGANWDMAADVKYKHIKEQLRNDMGCRVQGAYKMYQVPSKMLFATDRDMWLLKQLQTEEEELFNKFNLEHYFEYLTFGDAKVGQNIIDHFADYPEHTKLDMVHDQSEENFQEILASTDTEHFNYFKYISVVPHIFVDTSESGHEVDFRSYSYALTMNRKKSDNASLSMVYMIFDYSPVSMMFTKQRMPLPRFLINICAIVGGVFVVFGIINSGLL
jgi:hypothetical protein